jgi:hypothetical protein
VQISASAPSVISPPTVTPTQLWRRFFDSCCVTSRCSLLPWLIAKAGVALLHLVTAAADAVIAHQSATLNTSIAEPIIAPQLVRAFRSG